MNLYPKNEHSKKRVLLVFGILYLSYTEGSGHFE